MELGKFLGIFSSQSSHFFIFLDGRAGAEQIPVPIDIVDAIDAWPVLGINQSAIRINTLCFGVWPLPVVIKQILDGMRCIL